MSCDVLEAITIRFIRIQLVCSNDGYDILISRMSDKKLTPDNSPIVLQCAETMVYLWHDMLDRKQM